MSYLLMIPAALSALLLAAHFLRGGQLPLVAVSLLLIPFVVIPRRWAVRIVQTSLVLGSLAWLLTLVQLVQQRQEAGQPWLRLAIILGSVMLFTALSALLLEAPPIRRRCPRPPGRGFDVIVTPGPPPRA